MLKGHLTIGQLAERTGCKVQTTRYYEQVGLMPEALRTEGNQRRFGQAHHERLTFVRHCRELGFPLAAIRKLLVWRTTPSNPARRLTASLGISFSRSRAALLGWKSLGTSYSV
jgi:DNA-binding transcriptional MerR regulator